MPFLREQDFSPGRARLQMSVGEECMVSRYVLFEISFVVFAVSNRFDWLTIRQEFIISP